MYKLVLLLALFAQSLTACTVVRYYEVKPLSDNFNETAAETNRLLEQVRSDLKLKRSIIHSLKIQGANLQEAPYSQLMEKLTPIQSNAEQIEKKAREIRHLKVKFHATIQGKTKITSKSSDYQTLEQLKSNTEAMLSKLEKNVKSYHRSAQLFETRMSESRIRALDVQKTQAKLNSFLRKLDANISLIRSRGSKVQAASLGKSRVTYQKISEYLALIERERVEVAKLINQFNKIAGNRTKLWIGPGLFTSSVMVQGEKRAVNIQNIGKKISELSNKI